MSAAWPKVRLGDVLHRSEEIAAPVPDNEYREITVRLWGRGVVERGRIAGASLAGNRRFVARAGQFIASSIDARKGAMGIVPQELDGAVVTNDFPVFHLSADRLVPSFLGWLSRTPAFVELCQRASEGTTNRVRLKEDRFLALNISLPPLAEQRRVGTRIEELATEIQGARSLRQKAAEEADAMMLSKTSAVFDSLLGSATAPLSVLGDGGENPVQTGPFGAQLHASDFVENGVPVLNVGNVRPEGLRFDRLAISILTKLRNSAVTR
jgi:type I restriction enzyme S subunit